MPKLRPVRIITCHYMQSILYKILLLVVVCTLFGSAMAQDPKMVRVTGTIRDQNLQHPVAAKVFYEKLPFYDDMGVANTKEDNGIYEFFMIKGEKYTINVTADGYESISQEITIDDGGLGLIEKNFLLPKDASQEIMVLHDLNFERGQAVISEQSYEELDKFADWLTMRPLAIVQLEGHTDFEGNADANMILSEERVIAVKEYLVRQGIKKSRLLTKAYGGSRPLSNERSPEARAMNRRVEVRILQQ